MIEVFRKIFRVEDLRSKIFFTLLMLGVCRLGAFIPVPGINGDVALTMFRAATKGGQNLFQLMDIFSGGAFAQMTIIALGVMPYISASIVIQLLMAIVPSLQREVKDGTDMGKRKLSKWTRLATLFLALFQSGFLANYALGLNHANPGIIVNEFISVQVFGIPLLFYFTVMITMTCGTLFLMWIGEQITEKGIGNGMSLIITLGILSSLPSTIGSLLQQLNLESQDVGQLSLVSLLVLATVFVSIIIGTILVIQGQRKIPLQHARRGSALSESENNNSYIPLKINYAGVIPVIFASSLLMFPATIGQWLSKDSWLGQFISLLTPGTWLYSGLYVSLIILFTYFWTAMQFRPDQIASDMKKNGAFIPGVRQGKPTEEYLEMTMGKITLAGALFLAFIAILPTLVSRALGVDSSISHFFGGTSLLIVVGVILDTAKQIESHLLMKRYDGFLKRGRIRGR